MKPQNEPRHVLGFVFNRCPACESNVAIVIKKDDPRVLNLMCPMCNKSVSVTSDGKEVHLFGMVQRSAANAQAD